MGIKQDLVFPLAKHWIAGKDMDAGLQAAREANTKGFATILNFLGEDVTDAAVADSQVDEYFALQRAIADRSINGATSVKLTQLGLLVDEGTMEKRLQDLSYNAATLGQQFWLDMESSRLTDKTLDIYTRLHQTNKNAGVALQAYLRRSEKDLSSLLEGGAKVRLVKGAYKEDASLVFATRAQVTENYSTLMSRLFDSAEGFTVATHDPRLIDEARRLASSRNRKFDFAMLRGIRDDLKAELVSSGFSVVDYIPYGAYWYPYSVRRIREHPSNVWLLFRSLF